MLMKNSSDRAATLYYEANGFRVISPGHHVVCAVSGAAIPLDELRYWSETHQEAYASPELATKRLLGNV